jgi:flagellar motor protein MotB
MAAGKGGGSWKVAYADFVTAMMAFFLVMWIGAQDAKVRQSVANYFVDPSGVNKKPVDSGAVFDSLNQGPVQKDKNTAGGRGLRAIAQGNESSPATQSVAKWLLTDDKRYEYWRGQAQRCREVASRRPLPEGVSPENLAAAELASQLQTDLMAAIPPQVAGVHQELLAGSMKEVNWRQLAEELLAQ